MGRGGKRREWVNPGSKRATYSKPDYPPNHRRTKANKAAKRRIEEEELEDDIEAEEPDEQSDKESNEEALSEQQTPGPSTDPGPSKSKVFDWMGEAFTDVLDVNTPPISKKTQPPSPTDDVPESSKREVQILDLHTDNPIISYGGQIYSCQWAQNAGTELLFTMHDPSSPLPILRSLPDDVDLLGAISARITSIPATMETKLLRRNSPTPDLSDLSHGYDPDLRIPVGIGASSRRKDQAQFLESLMDLKEQKGEPDFVTVHAQTRLLNSQWRTKMKNLRASERGRLNKLVGTRKRGWEVEQAKERLREMDEEDERKKVEDKKRGLGPDGKKIVKQGRKRKVRDEDEKEGKKRVRRPIRAANLVRERFGIDTLEGEGEEEGDSPVGNGELGTPRVRFADTEEVFGQEGGSGEDNDGFEDGEEDDTLMT